MKSRITIFCSLLLSLILSSIVVAEMCAMISCGCMFPFLLELLSSFIILISSIFTFIYLILYWRERRREEKGADRSTMKLLLMFLFTILLPLAILLIPTIFLLMTQGFSATDIIPLPHLSVSYIPLLSLGALLKFHKRMQHINHIMALSSIIPVIVAAAVLISGITECSCWTYVACYSGSCHRNRDDLQKIDSALEKDDISVCDELRSCRDPCYQEFAEKRKDLSICEKIQLQAYKDDCYYNLAAAKKDHSICDELLSRYWYKLRYPSWRAYWRGNCYTEVAVAKKDLWICDGIQHQYYKDFCYGEVAKAKQDSSLCEKIQNQGLKDPCYRDVAEAREDPTVCEKIQDQKIKDRCYLKVAETRKDPTICDKIEGQGWKDSCYKKAT